MTNNNEASQSIDLHSVCASSIGTMQYSVSQHHMKDEEFEEKTVHDGNSVGSLSHHGRTNKKGQMKEPFPIDGGMSEIQRPIVCWSVFPLLFPIYALSRPNISLLYFSSFPQGDQVLLPCAFVSLAVFASLRAFGIWDGISPPFMCVEHKVAGAINMVCAPLVVNALGYYAKTSSVPDDEWASSFQTAAVLGTISVTVGIATMGMLLGGTCFSISFHKWLAIAYLNGAAAVLAIFTLIAGATNVCRQLPDVLQCSKEAVHWGPGACCMIYAFFLYSCTGLLAFWCSQEEPWSISMPMIPWASKPSILELVDVESGETRRFMQVAKSRKESRAPQLEITEDSNKERSTCR